MSYIMEHKILVDKTYNSYDNNSEKESENKKARQQNHRIILREFFSASFLFCHTYIQSPSNFKIFSTPPLFVNLYQSTTLTLIKLESIKKFK